MASSSGKPLSNHSQIMQSTKTKHLPRASLLLKDYLMRDELSSCSSNGFKSFPRRQCCNTVGFIMEKDLKLQERKRRSRRSTLPRPPQPSYSSCSSSKVSVLQRASEAVINAIKSIPLSSRRSGKTKKAAAGSIVSRSFSRKLLSRSFWRKAAKEEGGEGTQRWTRTSFRELLMQERDKTASLNEDNVFTTVPSSTNSSSGCGNNNSWGESEFTFSSSAASSSESSAENDVAEGTQEAAPPRHKIEEGTRDWPNEEKEQLSPVSVLDCPFEDDEGIAFHFNSTTHSLLEGTKQHMQKRRHFDVASLEPVALEKMMACSELDDEPHNHSVKHCSVIVPIRRTESGNSNVLHDKFEENERDLLNLVKMSIPSNCLIIKIENLLFDYFKQSTGENNDVDNISKKLDLCRVIKDWIRGQPQEVYLGWEVQEGRQVYIKEMDKCVEWKNPDQEVQQIALELENEVFTSLVNELVLDLMMC